MTFTRRIENGRNVYVYRVKTYREKGTGKVKQKIRYLGKEITKNGKKVILPPKHKRMRAKKVLSFGATTTLYHLGNEFGLPQIIDNVIGEYTNIQDVGKKIMVLAINKVLSSDGIEGINKWFCSTSIPKYADLPIDSFTPKKVRSLQGLLSMENPDVGGAIEQGFVDQIKHHHPDDLSMLVYDLTDLTFHGKGNNLARYGHKYQYNGKKKQINLVLAVTKTRKLPMHHRVLPGNIVSVSTIKRFVPELKSLGVEKEIVMILDRGFYSKKNMDEVGSAEYKVIAMLPSTLKIRKNAIKKSKNIEQPKHYIRYNDEVLFVMEHEIDGKRLIVYHSPSKCAKEVEEFYASIAEYEEYFKEQRNVTYESKEDLLEGLNNICKGYREYFNFIPKKAENGWQFSYKLCHTVIQNHVKELGKSVLFTTTSLSTHDVLQLYREKDVVEKAFCLMKKRGLTPVNATTEETTKSNAMLAVLGYALLALLRNVLKDEGEKGKKVKREELISLETTLDLLEDIKEVVYADNSSTLTDTTKNQEEILEKIGVVLK